jgi:urea transport system permease protein
MPEVWLFALGALFIAVVSVFPDGLAGLYKTYLEPTVDKIFGPLYKKIKQPLPSNGSAVKSN